MTHRTASRRPLVYVLFFSLFVFLLIFAFAIVSPFLPPSSETSRWPINEYGQTYGQFDTSSMQGGVDSAVFVAQHCPDLIKAMAEDTGEIGYVYKDDLFGSAPQSPEEEYECMESPRAITIPVYALDGKTVVGTMNVRYG